VESDLIILNVLTRAARSTELVVELGVTSEDQAARDVLGCGRSLLRIAHCLAADDNQRRSCRSKARFGPTVRNLDALLIVVAIRLAALVAAALVVRTLPDSPRQNVACFPEQAAAVHLQKSGMVAKLDAGETANAVFSDMLLHD
jgi:hypothetical protein